ncbi:ABC transporter substrate-binding protein [Nonomuraea sp. WAC 01424]|uniref:ABC transporter substrate-binding protein n=1 Tax=Nonomuraea sp. WAC 01424 TaxID=2203200 RepID=UPI00163D0450|nr:ABC transporter substrate-binding protein [Nonomuraea sp. WAC 01424]
MRRLRPLPALLGLLLAVLLVGASACSGSAPATGGAGTARSGAPPEKIRVGVIPIPDSALVYLARDRGYFAAEGLEVEPVVVRGGGPAIEKMRGGALEFALINYVTGFLYQRREPGQLKLVADAYHAAPGAFQLFVPPGSPIRSVRDLKTSGGPKRSIAVATLRSVATLSAETVLAAAGLSAADVAFKAIAGWATTSSYAGAHPSSVAGFQRAMAHAQLDSRDRALVTGVLGTYTKIPREVLPTITLGTFPAGLEAEKLQAVVDTMVRFGYLPAPLRTESMIVRPPWESGKGNP